MSDVITITKVDTTTDIPIITGEMVSPLGVFRVLFSPPKEIADKFEPGDKIVMEFKRVD